MLPPKLNTLGLFRRSGRCRPPTGRQAGKFASMVDELALYPILALLILITSCQAKL